MAKLRRMLELTTLAALLGFSVPGVTFANTETIRQAEQAGYVTPLSELLDSIKETFPGRVLKVDLAPEQEEGERPSSWIYQLKVLQSDGQVLQILFDAKTLEPLEINGKPYGVQDVEENR